MTILTQIKWIYGLYCRNMEFILSAHPPPPFGCGAEWWWGGGSSRTVCLLIARLLMQGIKMTSVHTGPELNKQFEASNLKKKHILKKDFWY